MKAVRMPAAVQVQGIEKSLVTMNPSSAAYNIPFTPSAERCKFAVGSEKLYGDGFGGIFRRKNGILSSKSPSGQRLGRVSRLGSTICRAAAASVTARSFQEESSLKDIDSDDLEKATPSLLEECSDLDWKTLVDDLRSEALHGLQSAGLRELSLKALQKLMGSWISDQMLNGIESSGLGKVPAEKLRWSFEVAARDLRMQANLQAAQVLAQEVDSTFDWETDVAELHQRILLQGGSESSRLMPGHHLLEAWTHAQAQVAESSDQLAREALSSAAHGQAECRLSEPQVGAARGFTSNGSAQEKSLFSLGAVVATGLAMEGAWMLDAVAAEASPEAMEAASRAPSWLVPAVLVFPPLSYFLFNLYRDKVNPYAKVTDWMFGVVVVVIVSNIVLMAVWGVRLY